MLTNPRTVVAVAGIFFVKKTGKRYTQKTGKNRLAVRYVTTNQERPLSTLSEGAKTRREFTADKPHLTACLCPCGAGLNAPTPQEYKQAEKRLIRAMAHYVNPHPPAVCSRGVVQTLNRNPKGTPDLAFDESSNGER